MSSNDKVIFVLQNQKCQGKFKGILFLSCVCVCVCVCVRV